MNDFSLIAHLLKENPNLINYITDINNNNINISKLPESDIKQYFIQKEKWQHISVTSKSIEIIKLLKWVYNSGSLLENKISFEKFYKLILKDNLFEGITEDYNMFRGSFQDWYSCALEICKEDTDDEMKLIKEILNYDLEKIFNDD